MRLESCARLCYLHRTPAMLEVQGEILKTQKASPPGLPALLAGDAVALATMWDRLQSSRSTIVF